MDVSYIPFYLLYLLNTSIPPPSKQPYPYLLRSGLFLTPAFSTLSPIMGSVLHYNLTDFEPFFNNSIFPYIARVLY